MYAMHEKVRNGLDILHKIQRHVDIDFAEWTIGGKSLLHAAAETGNLRALDYLIRKVNIQSLFKMKVIQIKSVG